MLHGGGGGGEVSRPRHLVKDPLLDDKADASACVRSNSTRRSRSWQPALADGSRWQFGTPFQLCVIQLLACRMHMAATMAGCQQAYKPHGGSG